MDENKSNVEELNSEEKDVYAFLDNVSLKKEERVLTLKELQKAIKSNPAKVEKMGKVVAIVMLLIMVVSTLASIFFI